MVSPEVREQILEPFLIGAAVALQEMANIEIVVRDVNQRTDHRTLGDLSAVIELQSSSPGALILSFPIATAQALARRLLTGVTQEPDAALVSDTMGELANVVAGQAKTALAGTTHHFNLSLPRMVNGPGQEIGTHANHDCLAAEIGSDAGDFTLAVIVPTM